MNKGTEIEKVIAYLEKRKQEGYTHVAITTPDKRRIFNNERYSFSKH